MRAVSKSNLARFDASNRAFSLRIQGQGPPPLYSDLVASYFVRNTHTRNLLSWAETIYLDSRVSAPKTILNGFSLFQLRWGSP